MKVYLDYNITDSGKGKFLTRLIPALDNIGVKCSFDQKGCDVALGVTRWRNKIKLPKILRVDGIHFWKDSKSKFRNDRVEKSAKQSDGIIWQSKFAKRMVSGLLGIKPKKEFVIYNGASPVEFDVPAFKVDKKKNVFMSARWKSRKHKRLKEMVRIAEEYLRTNNDVCFYVAGKYDKKHTSNKFIVFLGHLDDTRLKGLLRSCDAMLNLAWFDWCPNAVVESLVSGTPVICSNGSGVAELVGVAGIVLDLDKPLKPKMVKSNNPPPINRKLVFDALDQLLSKKITVFCPELYIDNIAKQYKDAFKSVIS